MGQNLYHMPHRVPAHLQFRKIQWEMVTGYMRQTLYDFCRENGKEDLLTQWDAAKNLPETPQTVTHGSHTAAWWQCENGHSWQAPVYSRAAGSGCPYCRGRKADPGFNDLASRFPELAAQWDTEKNAPTRPGDVTVGSHRTVWWRCEKGHSWRAMIRSRASGCGCPVCAAPGAPLLTERIVPYESVMEKMEAGNAEVMPPVRSSGRALRFVRQTYRYSGQPAHRQAGSLCGGHRTALPEMLEGSVWQLMELRPSKRTFHKPPSARRDCCGTGAAEELRCGSCREGGEVTMATDLSLVNVMRFWVGCEKISDLRQLDPAQSQRIVRKLAELSDDAATLSEWNSALEYLARRPPEKTVAAARERLIWALAGG